MAASTVVVNGSAASASHVAVAKQTKKNQAKRQKKKQRKAEKANSSNSGDEDDDEDGGSDAAAGAKAAGKAANEPAVTIDYVGGIDFDVNDPNNAELVKLYRRFEQYANEANTIVDDEEEGYGTATNGAAAGGGEAAAGEGGEKKKKGGEDDDEDQEEEDVDEGYIIDENGQKMTKKKYRKLKRMGIAQLKQLVKHPEAVEWVDVTAADPKTLVFLKAYKNTVPVPRHWSIKRKYLTGKRGIAKPPFELPDFIKQTGITEMREVMREKEENMKLRQKARAQIQPKMGKLEIDYQKLHDAFFRFQTKPHLTTHGEMYYEGKEYEVNAKERRPGYLSDELKAALGMPEGTPPPWLINMQRYGPPVSYPGLKIPGLNAPIPAGAEWGFHPGGWGRAPVDEYGNPLYGDVYGNQAAPLPPPEFTVPIETKTWGQIEVEEYSSDEEEEEEQQQQAEGQGEAGEGKAAAQAEDEYDDLQKPSDDGLVTPSGFVSTTTAGLETPDLINLRKDRRGEETPISEAGDHRPLYTILSQKDAGKGAAGFMGSAYTYDFANQRAGKAADVDVSVNPDDLDNEDAVREQIGKSLNEAHLGGTTSSAAGGNDFSDMVAENAAKKRKAPATKGSDSSSASKKKKEFKF